MGCGCKERREKMAKAFRSAAQKLRTFRSQPQTAAGAHAVNSKRKKSVGLGG